MTHLDFRRSVSAVIPAPKKSVCFVLESPLKSVKFCNIKLQKDRREDVLMIPFAYSRICGFGDG